MAFGMELGWRRLPAAAAPAGPPPAAALAAALSGQAVAAMTLSVAAEQAETSALVARMTAAPSPGRRALIDQAVAGLKADGVWAKLDWLIVAAAHDAQAARLNWVAAKSAAAVNAPAFTADRGFSGDAASAWLDLGEAITTGPNFGGTLAGMGVWINAGTAQRFDLGVTGGTSGSTSVYLRPGLGGARNARLHSANVAFTAASGLVTGHMAVVRTDAGSVRQFVDGAMAQASATSLVSAAGTACLLRAGTNYSDHRVAAAWIGGALGDGEVAALHARLNAYLTAIGGN